MMIAPGDDGTDRLRPTQDPVGWRLYVELDGGHKRACYVWAQTFYAAREKAAVLLQVSPDRVRLG